jgi:hypothetical protein
MAEDAVVWSLDETSLLAEVDATTTMETLSSWLAERGLRLGPWSRHVSDGVALGELLTRVSPAWASPRGHLLDAVVAATVEFSDGRRARGTAAPRRAVGPDPLHFLVGARGAHPRWVSALLRVERAPEATHRLAADLPTLDDALGVIESLWRGDVRPVALQLRLAREVRLSMRLAGPRPLAAYERHIAAVLIRQHGGRPLSTLGKSAVDELSFAHPKVALLGQVPPGRWARCCGAVLDEVTGRGGAAPPLLLDAFSDDGACLGVVDPGAGSSMGRLHGALARAGGRVVDQPPPTGLPRTFEQEVLERLAPPPSAPPRGAD